MTRTIGMAIAAAVLAAAPGAFAQQRGVTPTEVTFGMHTDLSGVAATYGVS
jgi:branched-chain amino acid transport system substrate-binding protein